MGECLKLAYLSEELFTFFKEKGAKAYIAKYGRYLPDGREVCDPTPMSIPVGCRKPMTLQEQLARLTPMKVFDLQRQWSAGDEDEDDLLDPEDPEDFALLSSKTAVNGSQSEKQTTAATPVAGNSPSAAQEAKMAEVPDASDG